MPSGREMFLNDDTGLQRVQVQPGPSMMDWMQLGMNQQRLRQQQEAQQRQDALEQQKNLIQMNQAMQTEMMNTYKLTQDPRIQAMPEARNGLYAKISSMAGSPISVDDVTKHQAVFDSYMRGIASGDKDQTMKAIQGLAPSMQPDELGKLLNNIDQSAKIRSSLESQKLFNEMNQMKVDGLRRDNALVAIGKPIYTEAVSNLKQVLNGVDTPGYKRIQTLQAAAPDTDFASKAEAKRIGGQLFPQLLGGATVQKAQSVADSIEKVSQNIAEYKRVLDDAEHGKPILSNTINGQPVNQSLTKEELHARIETEQTMLGTFRNLQAFYEKPFDQSALKRVQADYTMLDEKRKAMDSLEKSTLTRTNQYQQEAMNFRQSEAGQKHAYETAVADAQQQFASLDSSKQTPQMAAQVAKQYKDATGISVKVDDIMKGIANPNKPLVTVDMAEKGSAAAASSFVKVASERYDQLQNVPQVLDNIEKAKALVPSAKNFMGPAGESLLEAAKFLNNRLNAQINVEGIKSVEELRSRLFYGVMDNLKKMDSNPTKQQMDILQQAIGSIGTDPQALPKVLDAFGDNLRTKVDLHNKQIKSAESRGIQFPFDATIQLPPKSTPPSTKGAPSKQSGQLQPTIPSAERIATYGNRPDGTPKGAGYFGEIPNPSTPGEFSTELSIGVNIGGKPIDIPLLTPNLSRSEIESVIRGRDTKDIVNKAVEHAKQRMKQGKSPYADKGEIRQLPAWKPGEFDKFYNGLRSGDSYIDPNGTKRMKK